MINVEYTYNDDGEHSISFMTDDYALYKELVLMIQGRIAKASDEDQMSHKEAYK